jgi:hypothetical protein
MELKPSKKDIDSIKDQQDQKERFDFVKGFLLDLGQFRDPTPKLDDIENWSNIRLDEESKLTLQACITYDGQEFITNVLTRFVDPNGLASGPECLLSISPRATILTYGVLGLEATEIKFNRNHNISDTAVRQLQEIQAEIIEPIIIARTS